MNQLIESVYDELHSAWRFRWWGLLTAAVAAVFLWVTVFTLPDRYEADARVFHRSFCDQSAELYGSDGQLLATSVQIAYFRV